MKNISDKTYRETGNTHFVFYKFLNRAFYGVMWKNTVEGSRPQMTVWCMHIACCIPEATNAHTAYVIFITNNGHTNAPRSCVILTLPALLGFAMAFPRSWYAFIDMDMSYTRVLHIKVAYRIHHKWRHAFLRLTQPLLCARITCYVTVITHGRCYARA
jgi:hypothetical protein